jgi:hypothetical protein
VNHHCHANGCPTPTPPRLFMCPRHWAQVPRGMQDAVWAAYKAAPKDGRARDPGYLTACANAVEHVARGEGKAETNSYRRLLKLLVEVAEAREARHSQGRDS